jgi:DNA-binding CsgD family transcriptional regulator
MSKNKGKTNSKELSDRQTRVLTLICKELSPGEISGLLKISCKTFFNHRANIILKTGARTNIGLFKYALLHGFAKI